MHYLATIRYNHTDSFCQSFDTEKEAKEWLDSRNNNLEHPTTITKLDDKWNTVESFCYTEGSK